jgi:hypothetical protein
MIDQQKTAEKSSKLEKKLAKINKLSQERSQKRRERSGSALSSSSQLQTRTLASPVQEASTEKRSLFAKVRPCLVGDKESKFGAFQKQFRDGLVGAQSVKSFRSCCKAIAFSRSQAEIIREEDTCQSQMSFSSKRSRKLFLPKQHGSKTLLGLTIQNKLRQQPSD